MEAWAALRCSQVSRTGKMGGAGTGSPQIPHPTSTRLGQAAGRPRAAGTVRDCGVPGFSWWGPPVWLPSPVCWGQHHAWDTALDPRPLQRARRGRLLRGKAAEGRSSESGERHGNAAGKGDTARGRHRTGWETGARLHQWLVGTRNHPSVALSPGKRQCGGGIGPSGRAGAGKGLSTPRGSAQLRSRK